jgi:hypothetical protein
VVVVKVRHERGMGDGEAVASGRSNRPATCPRSSETNPIAIPQ